MQRVAVLAILALSSIGACNKPQPGGTEPARPADKTREEHGSEAEERAAAVPKGALRERLVANFAGHPEPFLNLRSGAAASQLRPMVAKPVALQLAVPGAERWSDVGVTRFVVRSGDMQETISVDRPDPSGAIQYRFASAGPAMLILCTGPKNDSRSDAWQHASYCSKTIVNVADTRRAAHGPDADLLSEAGLPIEVVPLASPAAMTVGAELPASFHFMNEEEAGTEVAALRPDGTIDHQVTNRAGIAYFSISQPGRWVIRFVKAMPEGERVGELVFEITENRR